MADDRVGRDPRQEFRTSWPIERRGILLRSSAVKTEHLIAAHRSRLAQTGEVALDERTAVDLDLVSVFRAIDRTASTLGQQALFHRLRTKTSPDELNAFERLVSRFAADVSSRGRARAVLIRLQEPHGYDVWWLGEAGRVDSPRWHALFPVLAATALAIASATAVWHGLWPLLLLVVVAVAAVRLAVAERISALGVVLRKVPPLVATGADLSFLVESDHPMLHRLPDDVASLRRLQTIARWLSGDPLMLASRADVVGMTATAVVGMVYEYLNLLLLLDANGAHLANADVRKHAPALLRLVRTIGDIDAAISVAEWRAEHADWTYPLFVSAGEQWHLMDIRHPLVRAAVPNTVRVAPGRGALISGSNMSGKSTFLRTVGVNVVLAQSLHTCLAARYEVPFVEIRSCIGRVDDIMTGKSYYLAEVESVVGLMAAAESTVPHLFLFDELFRGTNTVERIAAADGVLATLIHDGDGHRPHVVLATTHDDELGALLRDTYDSYHFRDDIGLEGLTFDFRLRSGPATTRNAIRLLARSGAPRTAVNRALATAAALDARESAS